MVVIGGGLIGWACAWELAGFDSMVTVIDDERPQAASPVAAGLLIPAGGRISRSHLKLKLESARLYPKFIEQVEREAGLYCGYHQCGTLTVAYEPGASRAVEGMVNCLNGLGVTARSLDRTECETLVPALGPEVGGGYFCDHHVVDPRCLHEALRAAALSRGVNTIRETAVLIEAEGVKLSNGTRVPSDRVLVASGAWLSELLPVDLYPVKGETLELHAPNLALSCNLVVQRENLYLAYRSPGKFVLGATEEECGFDPRPRGGTTLRERALRLIPSLVTANFNPTRVGFRPKVGDGLPIIGHLDGLFVAGSHYRNGVLLAPVTAKLVAEMILNDVVPALAKEFDPSRDTRVKNWKRETL